MGHPSGVRLEESPILDGAVDDVIPSDPMTIEEAKETSGLK